MLSKLGYVSIIKTGQLSPAFDDANESESEGNWKSFSRRKHEKTFYPRGHNGGQNEANEQGLDM